MKKITLFLAVFATIFAVQNSYAQDDNVQEKTEIPCIEESMDDSLYLRAMGMAEDRSMQHAMRSAQHYAQRELLMKIQALYGEVDGYDIEIICNSVNATPQGTYIAYVAVQVPKKEIEKLIKK